MNRQGLVTGCMHEVGTPLSYICRDRRGTAQPVAGGPRPRVGV